ncbi:outer membrane protein [Ekhidna lutea]|uniref:Outer membrane protein n=2 Tax=Ekhidna lutea TaxID=447679 RepID=A0A239GI51_EKHLU|nr:outer membrane protein [Ekhidna lutea]
MKKLGLITTLAVICSVAFGQEKRVLTLQECIEIAVDNNLNVKRSELNLQTAEVNLMQSQASRYPSLNANGNYGYNWGRGIDPTTNQFIDQRINFNSVGASTNIPVIQGLQVTNSIRQDKLNTQASRKDLEKAENDISLNTANFYLNVIFNKELLDNAQFQLESSQQQLDRTKKLVASGALPLSNELQLESQVATNEVNLINAQNNLDLALLSLKQALLLPPGQEIDVIIPDITIDQAEIENSSIIDLYNQALANMPEIQSAKLRVESSEVGVEVAKGGMYPSLSVSGRMDTRYSDASQQFVPTTDPVTVQVPTDLVTENGDEIFLQQEIADGNFETVSISNQYDNNFSRSLTLNLSIPIFNGFNTRGQIQRSKIAFQQAKINEKEQQNILYQTIESSYRNAVAAAKTYSASQKQVASLEETFRAVENQYNNGAANFTDYQVASNNLFQARTDLSRAKYDFVFKQKVLEFYQGKPLTF